MRTCESMTPPPDTQEGGEEKFQLACVCLEPRGNRTFDESRVTAVILHRVGRTEPVLLGFLRTSFVHLPETVCVRVESMSTYQLKHSILNTASGSVRSAPFRIQSGTKEIIQVFRDPSLSIQTPPLDSEKETFRHTKLFTPASS